MQNDFSNYSSWFKPVDELTFADDFMFGKVMENKEICKRMIRLLLGIKVEKLDFPHLQEVLNPYYNSKIIRLDVYAADSKRIFDVEMQIARKEDLPLRMRYYQGLMDTDFLLKGNNYIDMKESYIVFICLFDPIGDNMPVYTIEQKITENGKTYRDKTHKVLYNANAFEKSSNKNIKAFLRYIKTYNVSDVFTELLERRVAQIKHEENYRKDYMTYQLRLMELTHEARKEGVAYGIAKGAHEKAIETARTAILMGMTQDVVAKLSGLSITEIEELQNTTAKA